MSRTDPNKRGGKLYEASRNLTEYNQQLRSRGASGNIPVSTSPTVSVPKAGAAPAGTRIQSDYEAAQRANARRNYEYRQTTGQLPSQSGENQELSHRRDVVRDRQANYLQTGGTIGSAQNQVFQRSIDAIDAEIARRQNDRQKEAQTRAKNTADALKYNQKTFEKRAKEAKKQYGEDSDEYRAAQQRADEATKAVWEAGLPWQMRVANYADAVGGRLVGTAPQMAATLTRPPENEIRDNEFSRRYQAMNNWLQSAADYFYDVSAQGKAALKYGLGKVGSTVADVAVTGGEMLSDAAMNMILPGSGMAAMGLRAGASGANEAYHAGATPGQEFMYGAATAGVEMLTEKMFDGMAKVYGAGAADEITEGIVRRLAETNGGRTLARMLINTPGEGIEEVVSDLANPFIKYIYDNGAALQESYGTGEGFKSMMQEAGYDFLVGAILGVGGAAASVTNGESAARNARLALQDDFIAQMSTGDGSSFFIEPHSGQTTRFGVEQYGDTWWGYAIDGQGKTYWQNGYKSRSAAERGTAVAASDWIVEQAANPENRANDADVRARDEQRAETAAENPGSTIADDQAVEIQKTLQDSGAKNSSLAQAVKLSGIVDKILNGDTSLSNREILSLDLYHNGGLLDIVEQKTGEKIDTSSNKKILAGIRSIIEQRAERFEAEDTQKTAQAAAATTQSETQILPQIEQEAATDVQEAVLADEAQEPAVQTEIPVVDSIPDNTEKPGQASARTKSPILSKAEMDAYNARREERLEKARQKGAEKRARVKKEKEEAARRESAGKQAEETAEIQPIVNNKSVAIPNGNGYTEEKQSGYSYLSDRLERGYDRVDADGLRYFITRTSDGYRVNIDRIKGSDGYVTDARSRIYSGGPFADRADAVDDLLSVARVNFYPEEQRENEDWEDIDGNAIRAELERRRASGESPVDNMLRQAQEIADQQFGTKGGYNEQERTRRDGNASEETNAQIPQQKIADEVRKLIEDGIAFTNTRLFEIANKAYGGTMAQGAYTVKDAYDGMELAVNQYLLQSDLVKEGNGDAETAKKTLAKLQALLRKLPTQTKRTAEMESYQQFSTPPNIAYLAAWTANVNSNDVVLEPSAGIGGLALWPKAWGATVYGNELSERRLAFLNQLGLDGTFNLNAEQINNLLPDEIKPTTIIMNPPFSSTAGRTATNKTANAKRHIEQALDRLEDGGRLVAILGNGMEDSAPAFRAWWNDLRREYSVRANIRIDGENYKKYGTTFDVQLVVIDKTGPNRTPTITGTYKDISEIPDLMEGIRNDRTRLEDAARNEQNASVTGMQSTSGQTVGRRPVSRTSTSGDVGEQLPDGTEAYVENGMDRVGDNVGSSGQFPVQKPESSVPSVDEKRRRGNNGQRNSGANEKGEKQRGQTTVSSGRSAVDSGTERVQLELGVSDNRLTAVSKNPDSVYSTYSPSKVHIKGAKKHPAKLVESAAMGAVLPPDPTYTPSLPARIAKEGILSDAQFENVVYAGQAHSQSLPDGRRKGYFIGDGTGVGKGRQLAGIIMDNYLQGRTKAVWVSEKTGLVNDARRDWSDLGGNKDAILDFSKYKLGQPIADKQGVMFTTYDTLKMAKGGKSRIDDLKAWLGEDFDGVIAFDEAHNMGGFISVKGKRGKTKPAAKAIAGVDLQKAFPNARIVYASATGATDITQYGYLDRLGLWGKGTAFNDVNDFISKISDGGLAAMELVARDMKAMGVYMARSISYDDVKYDTLQHDLTPMQTEIYNTMSRAWQKVLQNMNKALEVTGQSKDGMARGRAVGAFYSTQQRFYNQIITSMAMPSVIEDMRRELAAGRSCVLQLTNTNAAQADRALAKNEAAGGSLDDLDLTPSDTLIQMLEKSFPVELYEEYTDEDGKERSRPVLDKDGKPVLDKKAVQMRDNLIAELQQMKVPDGPLEMLLDAFGADNVAEVTGRTRRVVEKPDENGNMKRVVESRGEASGIADANMFQDGKKRILVFSDAGGTGRSYHADLRAKNQQQRVHYLLQPGWSASKAVQGFGRTHRSNQASAPIFRLVTTNVMGQKRFTSTIARRLDQLGALTKGQRQASGGVFGEKDNLENPIAMDALATFYKSADKEVLKKLGLYDKLFDEWGRINEGSPYLRDISKFLNRILSLEVDEQNATFQQFYDTFERMMDAAIANGTVDMGLENFRADKVEVLDETVIRKDPSGADTRYVQMKVYRKPEIIPFSSLENSDRNFKGLVRLEDGSVRAVYEISSKTTDKGEVQRRFSLESPVRGTRSVYVENTLKEKTTKINKNEWARAWKSEIEKAPEYSETTLHLLTGTLLPIWNRLPANNTRVMRVVTSDGKQYLGRVIRSDQIDGVLRSFGTNRTMQTYTPEQLSDLVLKQGKEISLRDNRVKIMRRRVSGEWRMEITGNNIWYIAKQHPGVFSERINYDYRYFIPTGEAGTDVLSDITKDNPVVDVREAAPSENVDANLIGYSRDAKGEWSAERIKGGDEKEKAKSLSEIVEQIRHDFGVNITTGHVRGKRGQYDRSTSGIRSKLVNDLPNIAHELGHHLDNLFDLRGNLSAIMRDELENGLDDAARKSYPKKKLVSEGIAEYFRKYLQNRETAAIDYPEFTAYLKNLLPARDAAQLDQLADEVNAYYSLDADTATSSIRLREEGRPDARTLGEKIRDKADVLYQAWTDSNHGIKIFDEETGADTYKLATNAAYSDAIAGQVIIGDLTDANGKYISGGLTAALHGINLKDKEAYRLFGEYLIVRHGPERLAEGMRIFADDRKNSKEFMDRRAMELEQQHPEFKEAADRLYQFQRDCRQAWLVDTGLISADTAEQWDKRWQYYVPLNRAVSMKSRGIGAKRGFANQKSPIKKARGSGLDIIHPVDNIINNIVLMVNAGVRNNVMRKITDEAERLGADASLLEHVPTPMKREQFRAADLKEALKDTVDNSEMTAEDKMFMLDTIGNISDVLEQFSRGKAYGDVITVMKDGKPEFWKINDPLLLESITSMSPARQAGVLDVFARVSRFMTANITGRNLVWNIFSNLPRDIMTFAAYSKEKNPWRGLTSVASAWGDRFKKPDKQSALYKEFLALGGGRVSAYTSDKNIAESARKHIARGGRVEWWNPLEIIDFVADTVENGPRFATYKMMRENGLTEQEAFYEAMDITVNFRRGGRLSRDVNKIVPFFNAGVQGLDKFRRWISAADAPSSYREKTIVKRAGMYITASIILAAIEYAINHRNDDDEMYYHQLSAYTKHSYWCIPMGDGKFFCIPKPRELGVPASFFADVLNRAVDGDPYAFNAFYEYAANSLLPSVASDVAQLDLYGAIGNLGLIGVVAYMAANRDFLGRPIESTAMRNLLPEDRFTEKTAITSKWLGRAFSKIPGAPDALKSPAMWDYFLSNTLGGFQKANKALFPVGSENRDWSLGVKNTWVKDARYSTDLVNWMYDRAEASSQEKRSNPDDPAIAVRAKMDDNLKSFYSSYYALAKNEKETEESTSARQTVLNVISEYRLAADYESPSGAEEVVRGVAERLDDTSLLPGVMNTYVKNRKGEKITLSAPDYVKYQMDYLRIYWEGVERLANRNMSDSRLAESIQKAKTTAKNVATGNALSRIGEKSSVWGDA